MVIVTVMTRMRQKNCFCGIAWTMEVISWCCGDIAVERRYCRKGDTTINSVIELVTVQNDVKLTRIKVSDDDRCAVVKAVS